MVPHCVDGASEVLLTFHLTWSETIFITSFEQFWRWERDFLILCSVPLFNAQNAKKRKLTFKSYAEPSTFTISLFNTYNYTYKLLMKILTGTATAMYMMYAENKRSSKCFILLNSLVGLPSFSFIPMIMSHAHITQSQLCKYRCQ